MRDVQARRILRKLQEALGDVDAVCYDPAEGEDFIERVSEDLRLVYEA